jgi:O-antigen/teichoic acid export membrane protein
VAESSSSPKYRRAMNMVGLLAGFGLGQGSLFAVQTWLLATGEIAYMGRFAIINTMILLAYQAIDLGGLVILARHVATENHAGRDMPTFFWSFSAVRLIIAFVLTMMGVFWLAVNPTSFNSNYTALAIPGLIMLAVSPGGILDGYSMSGWTGATWALPFLTSAIALPFGLEMSSRGAGMFLGGALSLGAILAVAVQYGLLHRQGLSVPYRRPKAALMRDGSHEALLYLGSWLPGQLSFRAQVGIAAALLGTNAAALLIYAKQVIMIATRFLVFARRVEYPDLVKQLADRQHLVSKVMSIQKISLSMGVLGTVIFAVSGLLMNFAFPHKLHGAGLVIATFAPIILTASVYATFMQACYAVKRTDVSAWTAVVVDVIGLGLVFALVPFIGMTGIALAEGLGHVLGVTLLIFALRRI